jgi:ribosome-binding factor A
MRGLKHASGFFQSRVADRLQMRFTPVLTFELDESVRKSVEMSRLIDEALASDRRAATPDDDEEIVDEEEAAEDLDDDGADDSDVGLPR